MIPRRLSPLFALPILVAPLCSQTESTTPVAAALAALPETHGLERDEVGAWRAFSTRFNARFDVGSVEFTPALGRAAPVDRTWSFTLLDATRGDAGEPIPAAAPERSGDSILYRHDGMVERYTVTAAGLKQDFVFERLPPGANDLVVRGRVATELMAGVVTAAGLRFTHADLGGIQVGAVVGIDAAGQRCGGQLEFAAGVLSLRLPAAFVATARLPLCVDPLISTFFTTSLASSNIGRVDAAHEPDANGGVGAWLVVFENVLSASNTNIYGLRVVNGAYFGGLKAIETSASVNSYGPRVAVNNQQNNWLVVYGAGQSVFARGYWAADVLYPTLTVSTSGQWPVVGGDSRSSGGAGTMVAWADSGAGLVHVRVVTQSLPDLAPQLGAQSTVSSQYGGTGPIDISRHGGALGQWLITYPHFDTFATVRLFARVWNGSTFASNAFNLGAPPSSTLVPAVDGDGDDWVVAWRQPEATALADGDILARSVRLRSTGIALGTTTTAAGLVGRDEFAPSVAWLGDSALLAWSREAAFPGQAESLLRSIDTLACASCEGSWLLDTAAADLNPRVAASCIDGTWPGSALAVWRGNSTSGALVAQAYLAADGLVTRLSGQCGAGGDARASCPRSPNLNFRFQLHGASPSTTAFLLLGDPADPVPCGGCSLMVDPTIAVVVAAPTSVAGHADLPMLIPSGASGRLLRAQWAVLGSGCVGLLDLSNGLQLTIQ